MPQRPARVVTCPGRVNLIGDHTDYNDGLALPMTVDLATTVGYRPDGSGRITVTTAGTSAPTGASEATSPSPETDSPPGAHRPADRADLPLRLAADPAVIAQIEPSWARLVAAVLALVRPEAGGRIDISSTVPVGAGLSSSSAVAVATALSLGANGPPLEIAGLCQAAESLAGVPTGIMDPLVCTAGRAGHALAIDFATGATEDVPLPPGTVVVVVDSGERRLLTGTPYATRVAECRAARDIVGPLPATGPTQWRQLADPVLRRRARHVATECTRVSDTVAALRSGDLTTAGALMSESHRSLAEDFDVSTPALDALVAHLTGIDGVLGARLTGAGFGGSVVALGLAGALATDALPPGSRRVVATDGAVLRAPPGDRRGGARSGG